MSLACQQKVESDVEGENSNDGEEAAVGALESLALGHHHNHMKGRGCPPSMSDVHLGKQTRMTWYALVSSSNVPLLQDPLA